MAPYVYEGDSTDGFLDDRFAYASLVIAEKDDVIHLG